MNGKELIHALLLVDSQSLRYSYVALTKTSMVKMISSKVQQTTEKLFNEDRVDHYDRYLKEEVAKLKLSDDELRFRLLLELAKRLNIHINYLDTSKGLIDLADKILHTAIKEYKAIDKKFTGSSFDELINYQLKKMFSEIDKQFNKSTSDEKEQYVKNVTEFLNQLPQDQQDKLREELGIEDFSQKVVSHILATGGTSIVFSAIVNTMGFSFYMGASSLLASSAGLFGITLPFAAYTTMSSVIAVLAAPLFIIGVLTFSGFYFTKQRSKLDKMIIPLSLMQIFLTFLSMEQIPSPSYDVFIKQWNEDIHNYKNHKNHKEDLQKKVQQLEQEKERQRVNTVQLMKYIKHNEAQMKDKKDSMKRFIQKNDLGKVSTVPSYIALYNEMNTIKREISVLSRKEVGHSGVLSIVKATIVNTSNSALRLGEERKLDKASEKMVDMIVTHQLDACIAERDVVISLGKRNSTLKRELEVVYQIINDISEEIKKYKRDLFRTKVEMQIYEEKYFGLEHLSLFNIERM